MRERNAIQVKLNRKTSRLKDRPKTGYAQSVTRDGSWNSVIVHLSKFEPYPHSTQIDFIIDFHINDLL